MQVDPTLLPTFIIGGAPRSGTTFLCQALDRNPDVYFAKPYVPEPKVFVVPQDLSVCRDRYAAYFKDARHKPCRGEKTTLYFESATACARIRKHLPDVRILFMLREPVARAYSNYLWSKKNGLETLPFEQAVELEGTRESPLPPEKFYARPHDYLLRGDYATFARRYLDAFGPERVAFFLYEDIERNPERLFGDIQDFIGARRLPFAELNVGIVNSAKDLGPELEPVIAERLKTRMRAQVDQFVSLTGMDVSAWKY